MQNHQLSWWVALLYMHFDRIVLPKKLINLQKNVWYKLLDENVDFWYSGALFNSVIFIFLFLPASIAGYFWLSHRKLVLASELYLCLASLFFYGYWNPSNLPIILVSVCFNYIIGRLISGSKTINKKIFLVMGIVANVLMLYVITNISVL